MYAAGLTHHAAAQWLQGAKWCAITVIVVAAPVIGKVAQVCVFSGISKSNLHLAQMTKLDRP